MVENIRDNQDMMKHAFVDPGLWSTGKTSTCWSYFKVYW